MRLRTKFTKWYYRKGYRADYDGNLVFECPWWVRLLATYLLSPSVYYHESFKGFDWVREDITWG